MSQPSRNYIEFDQHLLSLIAAGPKTAAALTKALERLSQPLTSAPEQGFRVVDRRLQALRKKGVIAWKRKGSLVVWILTEQLTTDRLR